MRSPNPKTLASAIAKAEFVSRPGMATIFTSAEARALIHETTATQAAVRYDGNVPPRWTPVADAWAACGWRDVEDIRGSWNTRCTPVRFVVSVLRGASTYEVDIITPALDAPGAVLLADIMAANAAAKAEG